MPSSDILRHVALIRNDVSKDRIASIIRVTRIGDLRHMLRLPVTVNVASSSLILATLMMEAKYSSKTSVLARAKQR
jgi:hypothetical protein